MTSPRYHSLQAARIATRALRERWLLKLTSACQRFVGDATAPERARRSQAAALLLRRLPKARTRAEDLLIRISLARLVAAYDRRQAGRAKSSARPADLVTIVDADWPIARREFVTWSHSAFRHVSAPAAAEQVATRLSAASSGGVALADIAQNVGYSDRRLRDVFRRVYGVSPRTYRQRARALRAFDLLRGTTFKNEAVARDLGLLSPKDLYQLTAVTMGLTPREVRRLGPDKAAALRRRLEEALTPRAERD